VRLSHPTFHIGQVSGRKFHSFENPDEFGCRKRNGIPNRRYNIINESSKKERGEVL